MSDQKQTYEEEIVKEFLSDEEILKLKMIALHHSEEAKYLQMHLRRTNDKGVSFLMIPTPSFTHLYGDGQIDWVLRKILATNDLWLSDNSYCPPSSLENTLIALVTMTKIFESIFANGDSNRESTIIIEYIPKFIEWNKYILNWFGVDIKSRWGNWVNYSHSARYCNKTALFQDELKKLEGL